MLSRNHLFLLPLAFIATGYIHPISVNGKDLSEMCNPGDKMILTHKDPLTIFGMMLEKQNLVIEPLSVDNKEAVQTHFNTLKAQIEQRDIAGKATYISEDGKIVLQDRYVKAREINMVAATAVEIKNSVLDSQEIYINGQAVHFNACFLENAGILQLETTSPNAIFKVIRITLNKNSTLPYLVDGRVNLETGEMTNLFVIMGAQKIEILFGDQAWAQ